jgi:hypothetical protein
MKIYLASLTLLIAGLAFGQATPKPLEFEVASIKPMRPARAGRYTQLFREE